jgi:hypothetical protein
VPFTAHNIDEDDRAYDDLIARGFRTVPVAVFPNRTITGFDAEALSAAVAEWRATFPGPSQS